MTLDYQSGSDVKLFGLVGAKHYNGRVAKIVSYRYVAILFCVYIVVCYVCIYRVGFCVYRVAAVSCLI